MVNLWDQWKKGFDHWEAKAAQVLEAALKSSMVVQPVGSLLSAGMRLKAATDQAAAALWAGVGLPTRRDQERTLHALNQLNSRLIDLEEKLADVQAQRSR